MNLGVHVIPKDIPTWLDAARAYLAAWAAVSQQRIRAFGVL